MNLEAKHIHFIGIGGIGISAIARMALLLGKKVTGSDASFSEVTDELVKLGATVHLGHDASHLPDEADLVVYTIAVNADNPELVKARERGVETKTYPEMLTLISALKETIAVSGTHGKTTTTAMIAKVLMDAALDPTVIVGSLLKDVKSNFIAGKGKHFIVEACEYRRSFLNINPTILVITNIDEDHLDYYKDIEDIKSAFIEMVKKIPQAGYLVINSHAQHMADVIRQAKCSIVDFSLFDLTVSLKVPGNHNRANAKAALAVAKILGIAELSAQKSLSEFAGTWRRFEYKGETTNGAIVYDDYAHHPQEIAATLAGAREMFTDKKITIVFQPHLYSRTKDHRAAFAEVLSKADRILLAPIYAAREPKDPTITSGMIADDIRKINKNVLDLDSFEAIAESLQKDTSAQDLILIMGAGDINKVASLLLK
jgi:UDP-N-acetylmuramate--alanine ligase